ncbi:MAG: hypothetical protein AAF658_09410 [Myxococcota bacterium]
MSNWKIDGERVRDSGVRDALDQNEARVADLDQDGNIKNLTEDELHAVLDISPRRDAVVDEYDLSAAASVNMTQGQFNTLASAFRRNFPDAGMRIRNVGNVPRNIGDFTPVEVGVEEVDLVVGLTREYLDLPLQGMVDQEGITVPSGVEISRVFVDEGDDVEAGQRLFQYRDPAAVAELATREANFGAVEANYSSKRQLFEQGHFAEIPFRAVEAEYQRAEAALELAREQAQQQIVLAPFAGEITDLNATVGQRIGAPSVAEFAAGVTVATLAPASNDGLHVAVPVEPEWVRALIRGEDVGITVQGFQVDPVALVEEERKMSLPMRDYRLSAGADPETGYRTLSVNLGQNDFLGVGDRVDVTLERRYSGRPRYLVPHGAIQGLQDSPPANDEERVVFVISDAPGAMRGRAQQVIAKLSRQPDDPDGYISADLRLPEGFDGNSVTMINVPGVGPSDSLAGMVIAPIFSGND